MRILHVHSDLQWGGIEQWLLQLVRHIDRSNFTIDLFSANATTQWRDSIRGLGLGWIRSPRPSQPWQYMRALRSALARQPRYDALHCHFADHGGLVLREAAKAGIPIRIAHSHIDTTPWLRTLNGWRRVYVRAQKSILHRHATLGLAASREAARSMFGSDWQHDQRWRILHYGIDLEAFSRPVDSQPIRRQLGFEAEDIVFGHVGRFTSQKNHPFLLDLAWHLSQRMPRARFLWIGDGPQRDEIAARIHSLHLSNRIVLLRDRSDVPSLMKGAMDAFLFPSLYEGLGIALVEAQAAGLPCFVSTTVPAEADVIPDLVTRIPLSEQPFDWAQAISSAMHAPRKISPAAAADLVRHSSFSISRSTRMLEDLYLGKC